MSGFWGFLKYLLYNNTLAYSLDCIRPEGREALPDQGLVADLPAHGDLLQLSSLVRMLHQRPYPLNRVVLRAVWQVEDGDDPGILEELGHYPAPVE